MGGWFWNGGGGLIPLYRLWCPPKKTLISFWFLRSCITMQKKQFTVYIPSVHSSFFNHAHPQNSLSSLNLCEIVPVCKKWVPSVLSWATVNFRFQRPDWRHSFLTMPHQGLSSQLLMFVNLHQHAKNEAVSLIWSGERLDLAIWMAEGILAYILGRTFFQIDDLYSK